MRFCFLILNLFFVQVKAQEPEVPKLITKDKSHLYDNDFLSKKFHKGRREEVRKMLPDSGFAIFFSNPIRNRANDVDFQYHQDPNFYYLTGFKEADAMLIIFKQTLDLDSVKTNEILFMDKGGSESEIWTGKTTGVKNAGEKLGITTAYPNSSFADFNIHRLPIDSALYITPFDDVRDDKNKRGDLYSLIKHFRSKSAETSYKTDTKKLVEIMARLREVKSAEELTLLRKAISITCEAQKELMKALEPGMTEYQTQAIVEFVFKSHGSEYTGYPSILGGGENSCILHYSSNRRLLNGKDLLLSDVGAEYHGYTADVTRTIPTDGKFSPEEKDIYNIVYDAQQTAIDLCIKGNNFWDPHQAATKIIQKRLFLLGITKKESDYRKYFMHGTSHYLGLDVHDAGTYGKLTPGQVITVEPGIYIPEGSDCDPKWWNIGIRIEDDILITETKPENLSGTLPRTVEEIEKLMQEESLFNKME